jgi:single-stranded DNA-specific DHH superfamily exonuclease
MDVKLQSEMDKLIQLSDFVTRKDNEANEKLVKAEAMFRQAKELESSLMEDAEIIEQQKEQLSQDRYLLAQERVAALKEKAFIRDTHMNGTSRISLSERQCPSEFGTPDLVLRKRLASIKNQLNKLRDD